MPKNKTKRLKKEPLYHSFNRVLLLTFPVLLVMFILIIVGELDPVTALIAFLMTFSLMFFLSRPFLKELEVLINYLKKEASGDEGIETPHFTKSKREAFRIVQAFNEIKNTWLTKNKLLEAQTLSDAAILDGLSLPILMMNENGKIVQSNHAAKTLFKLLLPGKSVFTLIKDDILKEAFHFVLTDENKRQSLDIVLPQKGHFKAILEKLPAKTKNGAIAVMFLNDVTAFKRFEENQRTFFANASHELKTPLSIFSGLIETMQGAAKKDPKAQEQFLKMMADQTNHMTELVQDLLTLCRIGQENGPLEELDLTDILQTVSGTLIVKADQDSKEIKTNIEENLPLFTGRRYELFRIFQNLIDNAIKYGKKGSPITVTLKKEKENLYFSVHNWGTPIPKDVLPHICERFYRSATQYSGTGTGLGLSIVQEIVNSAHGQISISSSQKQGTLFEIRLPFQTKRSGFFF